MPLPGHGAHVVLEGVIDPMVPALHWHAEMAGEPAALLVPLGHARQPSDVVRPETVLYVLGGHGTQYAAPPLVSLAYVPGAHDVQVSPEPVLKRPGAHGWQLKMVAEPVVS